MKTRWKFMREGMKSENGNCVWKLNEWKHHDGKVSICNSGFHCSKEINKAFTFVPGEILSKVQVEGKSEIQTDKEAWSDMRIIKAWKWEKEDSVALAIFTAELCLENFEKVFPDDKRPRSAIDAAKNWISNPTKETESAARVAESVAYRVARVAESVARAKLITKIEQWFQARIKQLEEVK